MTEERTIHLPSPEEIEQYKTPNGAWTRDTLAMWGVSWPPPRGWRKALEAAYRSGRVEGGKNLGVSIRNDILALLDKREELAQQTQAWADGIGHRLLELFGQVADADELEELANLVYWSDTSMTHISTMSTKGVVRDIYKGKTGHQFVPRKLLEEKCPACTGNVYATSAATLREAESDAPWYSITRSCCDACHTLELEQQHNPRNVLLYPNPNIHQLSSMNYRDYLQTDYWKSVSNYIKNRDNGECVLCGETHHLQVHHKTYRHKGYEFQTDLHTLCGGCHAKFHDKQVQQ